MANQQKMRNSKKLDYTTNKDGFFDYCHYKYIPIIPCVGKIKSNNLLINSFDFMKCKEYFYELVSIIRGKIGIDNTVWGVKKIGDDISWEFYFYNYQKKNPKITISNILNIVRPLFNSTLGLNENTPYFMFSMDIKPDIFINKQLNGIHVYVPNLSKPQTGFSYFLSESGTELRNHYAFYNTKNEITKIISKIKNSILIDFSKVKLSEILMPELIQCKTICVSNKKERDSIYYSGININQFLFFLKQFNYPKDIISFIMEHKSKLDHLQYDVGFDYKTKNDKLKIVKSGYYGTF